MKWNFFNKLFMLAILIIGIEQHAFAQFEEGREYSYSSLPSMIGTSIAHDSTRTVSYTNIGESSKKITNIITFKINENATVYFASGFTARVIFTLDTKDTSTSSYVTTTDTLIINYDKTDGAKYNVRAYIVLPSPQQEVKITVTSISITGQSGWDPTPVLQLDNEMRVLRYYTLTNNTGYLTAGFNTAINDTDAVRISWTWNVATYNNMTQLEWAWLENEMRDYYTQSDTLRFEMLFRQNSTRVDLDYNHDSYNIPLLYDGVGKLYYRKRAVYRRNDGSLITGPWNSPDSFSFAGHEPDLNWQSNTAFAENGKFKTVIQYFDGSLRSRQLVTKNNTTGNTIVGETIYDLQGRPNVQILPTPTLNNTIKYFKNFNQFMGQATGENPAKFFDLTPTAVLCNRPPALSDTAGNGKYYSANNPWLPSENKSKFIPDAQGYAYTETRFMDDATQRVRSQGDVGIDHQINSGHETKYYYGKPAQPELDALFGTEAGDASHYSKNMIQDANGQMSVSYTDMHGRTIATALAGDSITGISSIITDTIDYPLAGGLLTNHLLTPVTNNIKGTSIESISTILVPATTDYFFTYKLTPPILNLLNCSNQHVCFDCKYDLEISIKSENCGDTTPVIRRYRNLQIVPASPCDSSMGFIGEGIITQTKEINFSANLAPGSYVIRKTLSINDSSFNVRRDSALKVFLCRSQAAIYDSIYNLLLSTEGCGVISDSTRACDSCLSNLGSFSTYKSKYLVGIGINPALDTLGTEIHAQYTQDSLECSAACGGLNVNNQTLSNLRRQMLNDMVPFIGQYALDSVKNISGSIDLTRLEAKFNIFTYSYDSSGTTITTNKPYYRNPKHENGQSWYYTEQNQVDSSIHHHDAGGQAILSTINAVGYADLFQDSWANSLIKYHPEYSKLRVAETTLKTSYEWLDKVQSCTSYAIAHSLNYDDPLISDTFFVRYATTAERNRMDTLINIGIAISGGTVAGPSIWKIANGSVLCAGIDSASTYGCIMMSDSTQMSPGLSAADKDKVWEKFKTLYLSYRNEVVLKYINNSSGVLSRINMDTLLAEGKQLTFANARDIGTQNGWSSWWNIVISGDTTGLSGSIGTYITNNATDRCVGQKPFWKARLMQCEQLIHLLNNNSSTDSTTVNNIINAILDSMVMVCHQSTNAQQIYGASNVNPSYMGVPQNFEGIINHVLAQYSIVTPDTSYFCNPFSIDFPKPYGKNPPLYIAYSNITDTCKCNRFASLNQEAYSNGIDTSSLTAVNHFLDSVYHDSLTAILWGGLRKCDSSSHLILNDYVPIPQYLSCGYIKPCITCGKLDTLTQEFRTIYPAYSSVPYLDSTATTAQTKQNSLWARFLNYRTGFSKNAIEYLTAYNNCTFDIETNSNIALCAFDKPVNDPSDVFPVDTVPCKRVKAKAEFLAQLLYEKSKDSLIANFDSSYKATCLKDDKMNEQFYARYKPKEYHYTLYYYDQAGNLVKTIPPAAVKPNYDSLYLDSVATARNSTADLANWKNNNKLATHYRYNTLKQVIAQKTPDAGISKFWYDRLGRLVVSQNAKQKTNDYSYTLYDELGRITEVGERSNTTTMSQTISQDSSSLKSWIEDNASGVKNQITRTIYDEAYTPLAITVNGISGLYQKNLRNRVSYTYIKNADDQTPPWDAATFYTYDIHGNVDTLLQDFYTGMGSIECTDDTIRGNRFKKMVYSYDLISGKVSDIAYQPNRTDQFYHRYEYDAENKITTVKTSKDKIYWETDASYSYYRHGPLSRIVLGQNLVQGVDYAYTIQGWLKGINSTAGPASGNYIGSGHDCDSNSAVDNLVVNARLAPYPGQYVARNTIYFEQGFESLESDTFDAFTDDTYGTCPGADTVAGSTINAGNNALFDMGQDGRTDIHGAFIATATNIKTTDAYGFSLNYFSGDFKAISTTVLPFATSPTVLPSDPVSGIATGAQLFNGNIASMTVSIPKISAPLVYGYRYDQLNRIVRMDAFTGINNAGNTFTPVRTNSYHEAVTYDPNGNIRTYFRNGTTDSAHLAMDDLTYEYIPNTNKLKRVTDTVNSANYSGDLDNQTETTNYVYDSIGNLTKDKKEGIDSIEWTVYGKIFRVTKHDGTVIDYTYDAKGNRISKTVTVSGISKKTYYVRDASGNVMSIYEYGGTINSGDLSQTELHMYGSSRLGVYNSTVDVQSCDDTISRKHIFTRGNKFFELSNHLGNVLVTVSDKRIGISGNGTTVDYYNADVITANEYYPFGMIMPGRRYTAGSDYRYGFNEKEKDKDIMADAYDFGSRIYDGRVGKFLTVDPLQTKYSFLTPYHYAGNNPTASIDYNGKDTIRFITTYYTVDIPTGLGGIKIGQGGNITTYSIAIIPGGKDAFFVDVTNVHNDIHGGSATKTTTKEFFPNSGNIFGMNSSNITTSGFWWQSGDDDYTSLARISPPILIDYLEKHDPDLYGGLGLHAAGCHLQENFQKAAQIMLAVEGGFGLIKSVISFASNPFAGLMPALCGEKGEQLMIENLAKKYKGQGVTITPQVYVKMNGQSMIADAVVVSKNGAVLEVAESKYNLSKIKTGSGQDLFFNDKTVGTFTGAQAEAAGLKGLPADPSKIILTEYRWNVNGSGVIIIH